MEADNNQPSFSFEILLDEAFADSCTEKDVNPRQYRPAIR